MPIQFHIFDQQKVDNHHKYLESLATKGTPKNYEILVDGQKAVYKTDDPNEFYKYEDYMTEDTNKVKIIIYGFNKSPRNDQYEYAMKAKTAKEALDMGLDGCEGKSYTNNDIKKMVEQRQKEKSEAEELETLRLKVVEQEKIIREHEGNMEIMQQIIDKAKANGNKIGTLDLGEALSKLVDGFVHRHAYKLAKIPGFEGLAGIFEPDPNGSSQSQENAEASFKKKENSGPQLTEHEKEFIALFHELEKIFTQDEMLEIIEILQRLAKDKSQLTPILELLQDAKK